jgi:hypothetical protein
MAMKGIVFWDVTLYSLIEVFRRFGGTVEDIANWSLYVSCS